MSERSRKGELVAKIVVLLIAMVQLTTGQISLQVFPDTRNEAKFQGQEYSRLCAVQDRMNRTGQVFFEWLHDGVSILSGTGENLRLSLPSVDLHHQGAYSCRATLSDNSVIGPTPAGELSVLDRGMIFAPSEQYVAHSAPSSRLNCSYPGGIAFWSLAGVPFDGNINSPSFDDEGLYICDIFITDSANSATASTREEIRLYIFVPIEIYTKPQSYEKLEGNPEHTFRIDFAGRQAQNMTIAWYKDGIPIDSSNVVTTYSPSQLSGTTKLSFSSVRRRDSGVYRVVIRSEVGSGVFPREQTEKEISFQLDVQILPTAPTVFQVQNIYSTAAFFSWILTNQNEDESADTLVLQLTFDNGTFFRNETFSGTETHRQVNNLVPGINFSVLLVALNVDGSRTTEPILLRTLVGNPKLTNLTIQRLNGTHFTTTVSLAYTGGGVITRLNVHLRSFISEQETDLLVPVIPSPGLNLVWTGDIAITDPMYMPMEQLEIIVVAENQFGYTSNQFKTIVPALASTVSTPTIVDTTNGQETQDLPTPLWLIIFSAVLVTIVVTVMVTVGFLVVICYCKCKPKAAKYSVSKPGDLSAEEKQLGNDNALVNRNDSSDKNLADSFRNGSSPSIVSSVPSTKQQPEERYIDQKIFSHKRNLSNASSKASSSKGHLPSTTSSSPAQLKIKYENNHNMAEGSTISLQGISEVISKQWAGNEYQCSQTESDSARGQQFASSGNAYNHVSSNLELTNSIGSSIQGSHISLPYGSNPAPKQGSIESSAHLNSNLHRHHLYHYSQRTPSLSSSMTGGHGTSESICTCSIITGGEISPEYDMMPHPERDYSERVSDRVSHV